MDFNNIELLGLLAALGGGLLVGIERERRKIPENAVLTVGVRTCMLVAFAGSVAALIGTPLIIIAGAAVILFAWASYQHTRQYDPGLTTEFALLVTFLLGVLAMSQPQLSAGLFVLLTILLAIKEPLHRFTRQVVSQEEVNDALLLAASVLIVLPLLPDQVIDPYGVLNPRKLWLFAVLVMAINAMGYIVLRAFGPSRGLLLAGLVGGFVSSAATIASMGQRAAADVLVRPVCVAAGLLSNIATVMQLTLILLVVAPSLLAHLLLPLIASAIAAIVVSGIAVWRARGFAYDGVQIHYGRPFAFSQAIFFAAIVATALLGTAGLRVWAGIGGVWAAAATTGLVDVHAAAVTLGQLVAGTNVSAHEAALALAVAFSANSLTKCFGAIAGGAVYATQIIAGILVINLALVFAVAFS